MSLTSEDLEKLAGLARLHLQADHVPALQAQLNDIMSLADSLAQQDTTGVEPLAHPLAIIQEVALRLRDDAVTETDQRAVNLANAPAQEKSLFLVPKVID